VKSARELRALAFLASQRCRLGEARLASLRRTLDETCDQLARLRAYAHDYRSSDEAGHTLRDAAQLYRRHLMIAKLDEQAVKLEHARCDRERELAAASDSHRSELARERVLQTLLAHSVQAEHEVDIRRQSSELDAVCALAAHMARPIDRQ